MFSSAPAVTALIYAALIYAALGYAALGYAALERSWMILTSARNA